MDNAVALVEAYLRVNGYLTVTEYPVLEAARAGGFRTMTDLDVLAFRFPRADSPPSGARRPRGGITLPDPALACPAGEADMLIGEVKEGRAELNRSARNPAVLTAALSRFGCCPPSEAARAARSLLRRGEAVVPGGHRVRLVAFGARRGNARGNSCLVVSLGQVVNYLRAYLRGYWDVLHHAQFKDPAFGFLVTIEKALRSDEPGGRVEMPEGVEAPAAPARGQRVRNPARRRGSEGKARGG